MSASRSRRRAGVGLERSSAGRRPARPHRPRRPLPRTGSSSRTAPRAAAAVALGHGDQRKLEVAILLALEPDIFMFDEPTAGMSVDEVPVILDLIEEIQGGRATRRSCWSSTRWTWCAASPTASSCCINGALVADGDAGRGRGVADRAGGLSRGRGAMSASTMPSDVLLTSAASTRISAATTSCTASISRCRRGRLTMLLGRNGAGKTTTLRTIMGLWRASAGGIQLRRRRRSTTMPTPDIARLGIAYVPETMGIFSAADGAREHAAGDRHSRRLRRRPARLRCSRSSRC